MLRSPYGTGCPSVVRLSSAMFMRRAQRVELFGNISAPSIIAQGLGQFALKFWAKPKGFQVIVQIKYNGV